MQDQSITIPQLVDNVRIGKISRRQLTRVLTGLGVSALGIEVIVTASSSPFKAPTSTVVDASADGQRHLDLHDAHLTAQGNQNLQALHKDYAENAIVEDSMYEVPVVGRAAIIARKSMGFAAVTSAQITVTNRIVSGNQVTIEWVATGIHTGDLPGLPASNNTYTLNGVTVVIRENGKIVREALYYDADELYRQLGQKGLN